MGFRALWHAACLGVGRLSETVGCSSFGSFHSSGLTTRLWICFSFVSSHHMRISRLTIFQRMNRNPPPSIDSMIGSLHLMFLLKLVSTQVHLSFQQIFRRMKRQSKGHMQSFRTFRSFQANGFFSAIRRRLKSLAVLERSFPRLGVIR